MERTTTPGIVVVERRIDAATLRTLVKRIRAVTFLLIGEGEPLA